MNTITESDSHYHHLERMKVRELLININREDKTVALSVEKQIPKIEKLVTVIISHMNKGGRLFYLGAGTSGRLGIVDASECPPTYGVPQGRVVGIIAGGEKAIRNAVEFSEDDTRRGWKDLEKHSVRKKDVVIGISASGYTPYVLNALTTCNSKGIVTGCITCNPGSPVAKNSAYPVVVVTGPEFVTGSTRMKAGTAQKLVLNMVSTAVMVKLGRVKDNKMVDMLLSNNKLLLRGAQIVMNELNVPYKIAKKLLLKHGSVRSAINFSYLHP